MENFAYRLRLINAIAAECPVVYSIDAHHVTAIATDGNPVKPVTAEHILLYPGNTELVHAIMTLEGEIVRSNAINTLISLTSAVSSDWQVL